MTVTISWISGIIATHYGAVPVFADAKTGILYLQRNFRIGDLLTKYDVKPSRQKTGGKMANLVEASRPRAKRALQTNQ